MSVYRPKGSPYYQYDFRLRGNRFHGSTGKTSKRKAEQVEREEKRKARSELDRLASIDKTSITAVWGRWWIERGQHDSQADVTFMRLERLQDGLTAILHASGRNPLVGNIDDDLIAAYVARRRGQKTKHGSLPAPATVNREIQLLRRVLRRASRTWKMPLVLPDWGELLLPEADERVVTMGPTIEAKLLEAMREDFRPACRFLILAGPRCGNVFPLPPEALDFEQRIITLRIKSRKPGGRLFLLPMTREIMVLLANEVGRHSESVFTYEAKATRGGRIRGQRYPIRYSSFYSEFKRAAREIGQPDLRPHDLRHVAGTRILARTNNLRHAQHQLGHTRISTTQKYAHVLLDDLREAMEATHSPEKSPEVDEAAPDNPLKSKKEAG